MHPYEFELLYLKFARGIFLANDNLELKYQYIKVVKSFKFEKKALNSYYIRWYYCL